MYIHYHTHNRHTTALILQSRITRCTYTTPHTQQAYHCLDTPVEDHSMYIHYPTDTTGIPRLDNPVVGHSMYIHYPTDKTGIERP